MDKKNTLLLTVIAVATLLVAVVGATFAYFSVVNGNTTSTTTITGQTPDVGVVGLTTKKGELYLKPTAEQMSYANKEQKYYAVTPDGQPATSPQDHTIATLEVSNGADGVSYACTATLSIEVDGTMASKLKKEDAYLKLSASNSTGFNKISDGSEGNHDLTTGVSLKDIYDHKSDIFNNVQVGFSLTKGTTNSIDIKGDVWLENTESIQNDSSSDGVNDISNKGLTVSIKFNDLSCDLTGAAA